MMKRISDFLFSGAFLLFIGVILIVTIWRPKDTTSYYENRELAQMPEVTAETLLDGSWFTSAEEAACDNSALRGTILKLKTRIDLELLHRPVVNDVVVTDDELLLPYLEYETVNTEEVSQAADAEAEQLKQLNDAVTAYGGSFLYAAVPSKYAYFADRYPGWLNNRSDFIETETAVFFSDLERLGVPYIDIGTVWSTEGNPAEYMSVTDHHYTMAGCLSAYTPIMQTLSALSGNELRILTENDLILTESGYNYLGSYARKLCGQWQSSERLTYAELAEPVSFVRYNWESETPGASIVNTLPEEGATDVFYSLYMGGDVSETILQTQREDLPDLLVYGDSFTNAMETILYASFDETRSLDLRHYTTMSLLQYVEAYQPDYVLCIRDYSELTSLTGNGKVD